MTSVNRDRLERLSFRSDSKEKKRDFDDTNINMKYKNHNQDDVFDMRTKYDVDHDVVGSLSLENDMNQVNLSK